MGWSIFLKLNLVNKTPCLLLPPIKFYGNPNLFVKIKISTIRLLFWENSHPSNGERVLRALIANGNGCRFLSFRLLPLVLYLKQFDALRERERERG